ncbi:hypothetical protein Egran_02911 [Elaphomyces granulatus]|uniref:Protein CFT1 n=1 Tax=Elaphomyces granulatus TaxID=519963 RepID=A0A232LYS8_9EURO|nr:hypothetical protein Egran_02911 [Elaphomyces granulatus]
MQCYAELLPPSGVTHALSIPFLSATETNLVVAKTSLLQIYSFINDPDESDSKDTEEKAPRLERSYETKLLLLAEYDLPGTVTDISRVEILDSKSGGDAILLAFRNAKLSLIEWDPDRCGISTISIHYYEREDLTRSPWIPDLSSCASHLTVDPSSRCAILNFGLRNLAILPFHRPGDDLVMDDYDSHFDGDSSGHEGVIKQDERKESLNFQTPYASSFVLPLTALDPSLCHPISFSFLYEYREPTFGILYSQVSTSLALLNERKDVVFYSVFTLDLEQRASTTLLSVARLPSDLFKIVALPPPVGGALLIGSNELVHIDQAGKTNAVGVNEFARQASTFSMADQSDLALRLEGCVVEQLGTENGELVLVLSGGDVILVSFKLDGRSVSGLTICPIPAHAGGNLMKAAASCSAAFGGGRIFFGSEDTDSVLVGWSPPSSGIKRARTHALTNVDDMDLSDISEDQDDDDNYEDDLYSGTPNVLSHDYRASNDGSIVCGNYNFRLYDTLPNIGPIRDITLGKSIKNSIAQNLTAELQLVSAYGSDKSGGLCILNREVDPFVINSFELDGAEAVWSVRVSETKVKASSIGGTFRKAEHYVIFSRSKSADKEESVVYTTADKILQPFKAPEFNPNEDCTVDVGTLANGSRVVQVLKGEIRSYDTNLGLAQIYPLWDEDTSDESDERTAVSASFADPYLLILHNDFTLLILQADESGDLDEVLISEEISSRKWLSGCLYTDNLSIFSPIDTVDRSITSDSIFLFLLSLDCKLFIFRLPGTELVTVIEGVDSLLPLLLAEPPPRRSATRETLTEILVADLGDAVFRQPYLILRTGSNDLVLYRPFWTSDDSVKGPGSLRFLKEENHALPKMPSESSSKVINADQCISKPLRALPNVGGFSVVFMPGASSSFVFRTSVSLPHVINFRAGFVGGLCSFNSIGCQNGFIYLDDHNIARACQLPYGTHFDYTWAFRRVPLGEQIDHLAYSSPSKTYALGTSHKIDFKLPDDDEVHPEWCHEVISFLPQTYQSSVKLLSPKNWTIIDSYPLGPVERIMAVENINLEISEQTHERKDMLVVGTAFARGEDIAARGCIYVFDVIKVVPDPDRPETNLKLKLVGRETVKGAVTALSGVGGQGFLMIAQGQKCMVRGLKDDGSLLPVAFMDMQCHISVVKELKGTGMCIFGDALKGLWFTGYSEEPYKMTLFGKDIDQLEVVAADFLPDGRKLYLLVSDSDCNLHVLQYDPEDPKSSNGDRLLNRSTFHKGHFASTMTLLPRTAVSSEVAVASSGEIDNDAYSSINQVLITTQTGCVALVTPVSEESYRRLSALQSQLINTLEHPCGLNPRAYRAVESDGIGGRGMIDGKLLSRWLDLGRQRKMEIASRVGADEWEIRADLEAIGGAGLGYL